MRICLWKHVCVLSLISALSLSPPLFCSSTVTPGFFSLHKNPHSNLQTTQEKREKPLCICMFLCSKNTRKKHRDWQRTNNISEDDELERTNCHWRTKG